MQIEQTFLAMLLYRWWSFCASYLYNTVTGNTICWVLKVSPIPIGKNFGKKVVTRLTTNLTSNKEFYTNGCDFLKQVSNLTSLVHLALNWFYG